MIYLYVPLDESHSSGDGMAPWQSDKPPNEEQIRDIIDEYLSVFRLDKTGRYEFLEPIGTDDTDSWGDVPFLSK